jgi:chromosome segregation ATPase
MSVPLLGIVHILNKNVFKCVDKSNTNKIKHFNNYIIRKGGDINNNVIKKEIYEMTKDEINQQIEDLKQENINISKLLDKTDDISKITNKDMILPYFINKISKSIYTSKILNILSDDINKNFSKSKSVRTKIVGKPNFINDKKYWNSNIYDIKNKTFKDNLFINSDIFRDEKVLNNFIQGPLQNLGLNKSSLVGIDDYITKLKSIQNYDYTSESSTKTECNYNYKELEENININLQSFTDTSANKDMLMSGINKFNYCLYKLLLDNNIKITELKDSLDCSDCYVKFKEKINKIKNDIKECTELKEKLEEELQSKKSLIRSKDVELKKNQLTITDLEQEKTKYLNTIFTKQQEIEQVNSLKSTLENEIKQLENEMKMLTLKVQDKNVENNNLKENLISKYNIILEKDTKIKELQNKVQEYNDIIKNHEIEISNNKIKINDLEQNIQELKIQITELTEFKNNYYNKDKELNEKMAEFYNTEHGTWQKYQANIKELSILKKKLKENENIYNEKLEQFELNDKTIQYKECLEREEQKNKEIEDLKQRNLTLQDNNNNLNTKIQQLNELINNEYNKIQDKIKELYKEQYNIQEEFKKKQQIMEDSNFNIDLIEEEFDKNKLNEFNNTKRELILLENKNEAVQILINKLESLLNFIKPNNT